ncbi:MAG: hypothetical protein A4E49_01177 [Methanosaeta sp. PtaU1.Bin112]|nr:MAG: hypothetical protein A4E49_01177 [Methanosaeta sp. PtaU1.Bin112]
MKDFAGSSVTYYGLAREKLINKYPWLVNVLIILALVCMTGLAIYLISDLVSFASDSDFKGASIGPDHNGPENDIPNTGNDTNERGNIGTNSSLKTSLQSKEQSPSNLSKINSSLKSGQAGTGVIATGKSPGSSSQSSVNKKSGNPSTSRRSSSSSSSSKSSSANSAKISEEKNNQTNETIGVPLPATETATESLTANETAAAQLPATETATASLTANETAEAQLTATETATESLTANETAAAQLTATETVTESLTANETAAAQLTDQSIGGTQGAEVTPATAFSSLPSDAISSLTGPARDNPAKEPVSMIQFKTEATLSPESEKEASSGSGASTDEASVSDNADKAKSSKAATKNLKFKTDNAKSTTAKKSKVTASSQAAKVKEAKEKMKAKKDSIEENMKKKAAQMRSKAK